MARSFTFSLGMRYSVIGSALCRARKRENAVLASGQSRTAVFQPPETSKRSSIENERKRERERERQSGSQRSGLRGQGEDARALKSRQEVRTPAQRHNAIHLTCAAVNKKGRCSPRNAGARTRGGAGVRHRSSPANKAAILPIDDALHARRATYGRPFCG